MQWGEARSYNLQIAEYQRLFVAPSQELCQLPLRATPLPTVLPIFTEFYRFLPIFQTFLGDFNPQKLQSRGLQTLWEWKNRVLLEEYYIFNEVIPLEVE